MRATLACDIEIKLTIWPRAGALMIDRYFKTMLERFDGAAFRGFELEHWGIRFRGWNVTGSTELSARPEAFANFFGTVCHGDAVCWAWYSLGDEPANADSIDSLCLTVIGGAIAQRLPPELRSRPRS